MQMDRGNNPASPALKNKQQQQNPIYGFNWFKISHDRRELVLKNFSETFYKKKIKKTSKLQKI